MNIFRMTKMIVEFEMLSVVVELKEILSCKGITVERALSLVKGNKKQEFLRRAADLIEEMLKGE